jgi:polysaccharide export outer membrane protein
MIKFIYKIFLLFLCSLVVSCAQILEPVELNGLSEEQILGTQIQDEFEIEAKSLTLALAKDSKFSPYYRNIMVEGIGTVANTYPENIFLNGVMPPDFLYEDYTLGIGDGVSFILLKRPENDIIEFKPNDEILIESESRVGSDGDILLLGAGRLKAAGRTINELRSDILNILVRNGEEPNFQLEISNFISRKAFLYGHCKLCGVVPITDRPLTLIEMISERGAKKTDNHIYLITLIRDNKNYQLNFDDVFDRKRKPIFIKDNDQIEIQEYPYKPGRVFALSGTTNASIININPASRETMADIMFMKGGPFSNRFVKRSEIYLLRGRKPITAYHLDAQNASKIIVAEAMELRPSDIIFIAERPIISFSRLLSEISPLRTLLRDIDRGQIP